MTKTQERRAWALRIALSIHEEKTSLAPVLSTAAAIDAFLRDGVYPGRSS